jgi:pimeloyl-ACP methyl ester carboxylesterase
MYDDADPGSNRAVLRLYRATSDPSAFGRRQADALARHDRPALIVWGAADPYLPVALAQQQLEAFPSAQVEILAGSGHWPMIDNPEAVGRVVEPFLRAVTGAAVSRPVALA